jgi:hypothetical protein
MWDTYSEAGSIYSVIRQSKLNKGNLVRKNDLKWPSHNLELEKFPKKEQSNRAVKEQLQLKELFVFFLRHAHMLQILNLYGFSQRNRQALEHVCCQLDKLELSYGSGVMERLTWSLCTDTDRQTDSQTDKGVLRHPPFSFLAARMLVSIQCRFFHSLLPLSLSLMLYFLPPSFFFNFSTLFFFSFLSPIYLFIYLFTCLFLPVFLSCLLLYFFHILCNLTWIFLFSFSLFTPFQLRSKLTAPVSYSNLGPPTQIIPLCLLRYANESVCYSAGSLVGPCRREIALV